MTAVHIIEKYNTTIGKVIIVSNERTFNVGDKIHCDNGISYTIKGIQMVTAPTKKDIVSLIVQ